MGKGTIILGTLGGGLILVAGAAGIGWLQRDAILESMLEQNISTVSGVKAQIEAVESKPFQGEFIIKDLTLSNPKGFNSPHLLEVGQIDVKLNPDTLSQETVQIDSIAVQGVQVQIEQNLARNNLATLVNQLDPGNRSSGNRDPVKDDSATSGQGRQIEINRLTIQDIDAQIKVSAIAGLGLTSSLNISDIEVNDLDPYNAKGKLLDAISGAVTSAIVGELGKSASPSRLIRP
ncbi:MAG: AsmA family protein [Thermosynechococcaceae cyanobacterium]